MEKIKFVDGAKYRSNFTIVTYVIPREKISINELIIATRLLTYANGKYKTKRELALVSAKLYDARINLSYSISEKYYYFRASVKTVSMRYIKSFRDIYAGGIKLLSNIIHSSWSKKEQHFNFIKNQLYKNTQDSLQDPNYRVDMGFYKAFAPGSFLEEVFSPSLEEIEKVKMEDIERVYDIILSSPSFALLAGDKEGKAMNLVTKKFKLTGGDFPSSSVVINEREVQDLTEHGNYSQSIIHSAYKAPIVENCHDKMLYILSNFILGSSSSSILFREVREKNGLCYYVQSSKYDRSNFIIIEAGINANDYKRTIKLIDDIMKNISSRVTDELVDNAKIYATKIYSKVDETVESLCSFNYNAGVLNLPTDVNEYLNEIESITKEEICEYLSSLTKIGSYTILGDRTEGVE